MQVKPNSKESLIEEIGPGLFRVRVKAPPRENKANQELIEALARHFHVPKSRVSIVTGSGSKQKIVEIEEG